ncbi:MAG: glyoxalase [Alphaproteobacteria bacterium]|nr:glyoxalase [Alphaproteobacteria bacterium]
MRVIAPETVVYGVADMAEATRFWDDFGLKRVGADAREAAFETEEGARIVLRPMTDPSLPAAPIVGPTMREVIWGVEDAASLEAIAAALAGAPCCRRDGDGTVHAVDPCGYGVGFRRFARRPVAPEPPTYNAPGRALRVDERGKLYAKASPQHLSHVVLLAPKLEAMKEFYVDRLGFRISDRYPGRGYFLRGGASGDHHNLFLLHIGDAIGFHHLAFELRDIHEVFGGGLHMTGKGWKTHLGPGRHPISSCYFWYFKNPCGGAAEYDSDSDIVSENWQPRDWDSVPEAFAEWALADGIQRYDGIQKAGS